MILLTGDEITKIWEFGLKSKEGTTALGRITKAQAKKILIELQAIYNLPDGGMFHKKLGDFIQELLECIR